MLEYYFPAFSAEEARTKVRNVMHVLIRSFREGAFRGSTPGQAYFVKCDRNTLTQMDIDLGIVNIQVGFAPVRPVEFLSRD